MASEVPAQLPGYHRQMIRPQSQRGGGLLLGPDLCGWSHTNLKTGVVPLVADHVDGNWRNNSEGNLWLLCPNCDSLTPTYAALNRGNGRKNRVVSQRAKEASTFLINAARKKKRTLPYTGIGH